MGNMQSTENDSKAQQAKLDHQLYSLNDTNHNFSQSNSQLNIKQQINHNIKIPISQKYSKNNLVQNTYGKNQIKKLKINKINEKIKNNFYEQDKTRKINQKQFINYFTCSEQKKESFYEQTQQSFEDSQNNSQKKCNYLQLNKIYQYSELLPLYFFIDKLKISSAVYVLKILLQSYYEAYIVQDSKVVVNLNDCYINQLGELIVLYDSQDHCSSTNTPPVLDYCFNFVSVIYKIFEIVKQLIKQEQRNSNLIHGQKLQQFYKNVVQLIHYCKKTQTKSNSNVETRIYKKIMNLIQNFIQSNNFKENLLKDLLVFQKQNSLTSSLSSEKNHKKNQNSKNTKSSESRQAHQNQDNALRQAIRMELNKNSRHKIKNNFFKTENYDDFYQKKLKEDQSSLRKSNQGKHKRNITENNVNRHCKNDSHLYTQTNQTFNMKNITQRFEQVESQYSYPNEMNNSQNRNFKKNSKTQFSGRQFTQAYDKINKNNINYQYAINIFNSNSIKNQINQNVQNTKIKQKGQQKKVVAFKQVSPSQYSNQNKEQKSKINNVDADQKSWKKIKHQTSIDKLPQYFNHYHQKDEFKQNMNDSTYQGKATLDNKLQRSRLQMMARQVQVKSGTGQIINCNSSNTIGTEFKF